MPAHPDQAATLLEVFEWHVDVHPESPHILLYDQPDRYDVFTYQKLSEGARAIAAGLQDLGLEAGEKVALMLPTGSDYLCSFLGILMAGCVAVPIYPPARPSQIEDHLSRHARILSNAQVRVLITVPEARVVAWILRAHVETLQWITTAERLSGTGAEPSSPRLESGDVAFLQYTSGSTGQPKGVVLTHANLLANIRSIGQAVNASSKDVYVSWLPLYHDMGLIGAWFATMYYSALLALMSPLSFMTRPARWLEAISRHRATISAAPNFAYRMCLRRIKESELEALDLSSLRFLANGAEPIDPDTMLEFQQRFERCGLKEGALCPVYGLAESTVGLAFSPLGRRVVVDQIEREALTGRGRAVPAPVGDGSAVRVVACGQPLPGHEIRIVDDRGSEVAERVQGRVQFRGPSATSGYYRSPEANQRLFDGDWLEPGDLAYIADGDLYLTGRVNDVIIRMGRNFFPYELEVAVGELAGIRRGCVVVCSGPDPELGRERVAVLAETRTRGGSTRQELIGEIMTLSRHHLGFAPDDVELLHPRALLKTSSGKLRRSESWHLYRSGELSKERSPRLQIVRAAASALSGRVRRLAAATMPRSLPFGDSHR